MSFSGAHDDRSRRPQGSATPSSATNATSSSMPTRRIRRRSPKNTLSFHSRSEAAEQEADNLHDYDDWGIQQDETDTLQEVIMAVDIKERGTVGCCYYVAREERLYFMEDVKLGGVDVVEARRFHLLWCACTEANGSQ